jgi:hypothetical protein
MYFNFSCENMPYIYLNPLWCIIMEVLQKTNVYVAIVSHRVKVRQPTLCSVLFFHFLNNFKFLCSLTVQLVLFIIQYMITNIYVLFRVRSKREIQ